MRSGENPPGIKRASKSSAVQSATSSSAVAGVGVVEAALGPNPLLRPLVDADDRDHGARFFERAARLRQLDFFEPVADQRRDPFSFNPCLHLPSLPAANPAAPGFGKCREA
jgi:hypothetical protein